MIRRAIVLGLWVVGLLGSPLTARPPFATMPATTSTAPSMASTASAPIHPAAEGDKLSVTEHKLAIGDQTLNYRATAGTMLLRDESAKPKANLFFVSYERTDTAAAPEDRPITFIFNGGPGAAAVWLHLGAIGPKRVALEENGEPPAPPYKLVDNAETWLDVTDLVFIDPVGTGYSRPAPGEKAEEFFGYQNDLHWVGEFIRLYITRYQRWQSPKFLAGESYGTTRAAGLSSYLHDRYGIDLNGIILISTVLDFQTIQFADGNDLPYLLYLPSYAATAWYHKKLAPELQQDLSRTLDEVRHWTLEDYAPILAKGGMLTEEQRHQAAQTLSRYTGLPADQIEKLNLRIPPGVFQKTLLGGRRIVGRMDTRMTGYDENPAQPWPQYDPGLSSYLGVYSATFNAYARQDLRFQSDLPYEVLSGKVHPWDFGHEKEGYLNVGTDLRSAMVQNPHLRVLVASGYFDLATPFLTTDYTIEHMDLSPDLRRNIAQTYYQGGHMMYHSPGMRKQLKEDVTTIISRAIGQK